MYLIGQNCSHVHLGVVYSHNARIRKKHYFLLHYIFMFSPQLFFSVSHHTLDILILFFTKHTLLVFLRAYTSRFSPLNHMDIFNVADNCRIHWPVDLNNFIVEGKDVGAAFDSEMLRVVFMTVACSGMLTVSFSSAAYIRVFWWSRGSTANYNQYILCAEGWKCRCCLKVWVYSGRSVAAGS